MYRCWFAWNTVVHWVKHRPIGFTVCMATADAAMAIAAYILSATPGVDQALTTGGAILAGPLVTLAIRFIIAFLAAPIRHLEIELGREREANYELRALVAQLLQRKQDELGSPPPDSALSCSDPSASAPARDRPAHRARESRNAGGSRP